MNSESFFQSAWQKYKTITPDASKVENLLRGRGEQLINDHIALRTFNIPGISRLELGTLFEALGYLKKDDMVFTEKKLMATYWLHPDSSLPKVFISELILEKTSPELQKWIHSVVDSFISGMGPLSLDVFLNPSWNPPNFVDYQKHYGESEYAAWTAAFGLQVNHYTVLVNALKTFSSLQELNEFLVAQGLSLNTAGGIVKGTPDQCLEQSSTMANKIKWAFADQTCEVMSCYYEFARRYPDAAGKLFQGFIPTSADKIFESTFEKK